MYYKKKNSKAFIIAIGILIAIILIVALVLIGKSIVNIINDPEKPQTELKERISPVIEIIKEEEEGDIVSEIEVIINVKTDDEEGLEEVRIPNLSNSTGEEIIKFSKDEQVLSDERIVTINKNGVYKVQARGFNGTSSEGIFEITTVLESSAYAPIVPNGFREVNVNVDISDTIYSELSIEEKVDLGFVIEDENQNQFVWVPVVSGSLTRSSESRNKYQDIDEGVLNNSISNNYGFYVSRFEISRSSSNSDIAESKEGQIPWSSVTFYEAKEVANNMAKDHGYQDMETSLITGKAWDTILNWMDGEERGYSTSTNYGNYDGRIYPSGDKKTDIIRNIADIAGNLVEWTSEYDITIEQEKSTNREETDGTETELNGNQAEEEELSNKVVRGGGANLLALTPNTRRLQKGDSYDNHWGFRVVLYNVSNLNTRN